MECGVHSLPDEILVYIFSFLDARSILNASSVCKQWMFVMNDNPKLFKDVCICFNAYTPELAFPLFSTMSRKFCYFKFEKVNIDKTCFLFLKRTSSQFRRLSFIHCTVCEENSVPLGKIKNCINLHSLEIKVCNCWVLFSYLPNLKLLHLERETGFSDQDFVELQKIVPCGLTDFSLESRIVCETKVIKRFYSTGLTFRHNPTDAFLSFPVIEDFIANQSGTLVSLNLTATDISDKAALRLSEINDLRLKRVVLSSCIRCSRILPTFCKNQFHLIAIDLSGLLTLKDAAVVEICNTLPLLEEINLHQCSFLNESVEKLFQLKHLRNLDLACCRGIREYSFQKAIASFKSHNLEELSLCATSIGDDLLAQLLPLVRNLRKLNLSGCGVSNKIVAIISKNLTSLKYLNLSHCVRITDEGLLGNVPEEKWPTNPVPLSNIKGLEELKLHHCVMLTMRSLTDAIQFERLMFLDLGGCLNLTTEDRQVLKTNNPCLLSLEN